MNANDYYVQGQRSARMTNGRSPCNAYSMPAFGTGTSWQARYFADGFRAGLRELGIMVRISFEVDGMSGSTDCSPWNVESECASLKRAGYTINDVQVIA